MAAGILCFVPLFNVLSYEFSLALAVLSSLCAAHLGSVYGSASPDEPVGRAFVHATATHLALLLVPLILISANALRIRNCNYLGGLAFFLLLPAASVVCATAAGLLAARLVRRPAWATATALAAPVGSLALSLLRLYLDPPVYAFDPFFGYFAGAIYDEDVRVGSALLWFRGMNLAVVATLLLMAARRLLWAVSGAVVSVALFASGPALGFRQTAHEIEAELGGRHESEHFVILYREDGRRRDLGAIERDHEFRYAQLARALDIEPDGKIRSYLFPSRTEKRRLLGAGRTDVAKPWLREIYLSEGEPPQPALRHELAHVFGAEMAGGLLGVPPTLDMGLVEGLAVALDWPTDEGLDPHEQSRALRDGGAAPPLRAVLGTGFIGNAPARGYTVAGSFVRHLLDRYGRKPLRRAYATGDLQGAYGRSLATLETEWLHMLSTIFVDRDDRAVLDERFRRPAIWRKTCAHEIATLQRRASTTQASDPQEAAAILRRIIAHDPGEPSHRLRLADSLRQAGSLNEAAEEARRALAQRAVSAPLRQRAWMTIGDVEWQKGDLAAAQEAYRRAGNEPSGEAQRRLIAVKQYAVAASPIVRELLRPVVLGKDGKRDAFVDGVVLSRLALEDSDLGLASYLIGRRLWQRGRYSRAADELRACAAPLPSTDLLRECRRIWTLTTWRAGDLERAETAARSLQVARGEGGDPTFARDMLERLTWERGYRRVVSSLP